MIVNERPRGRNLRWVEWVPLGLLAVWVGLRSIF